MRKYLLTIFFVLLSVVGYAPYIYCTETVIMDAFCEGGVYVWENHYEEDGVTPLMYTQSGTYVDTLVSSEGLDSICVLRLTEIPYPVLTVRSDTTIYLGDSALLWATGADYIHWISNDYLVQTDELDYYATPQVTTQYTVRGYNKPDDRSNVVFNGNFDLGNEGFYTDCEYHTPYGEKAGGPGEYTIADNIKGFGWYVGKEVVAYGGEGNMMIVDGKQSPNSVVWQQTVEVKPNTYYAFSAQVMSAWESNLEGQYALLQFNVNGEDIGPIFHSPDVAYEWKQFYNIWYSGTNTTAVLTIFNQNNSPRGNDFAIDEIELIGLYAECQSEETVTITVIPSSPEDVFSIVGNEFCVDDAYVDFEIHSNWQIDSLVLHFDESGLWRDTVINMLDQLVEIPNHAVPGEYSVTASAYVQNECIATLVHDFKILYPSFFLDQFGDVFIGLLNHKYNGGYDFVSFQWYKDNEPLVGETKPYLYTSLEIGALYSVLLEDADGLKLMTCPIVATHQEDISLYPTVLHPLQMIHIRTLSHTRIELYDIMGEQLLQTYCEGDEIQLQAPANSGIYIVKILYLDDSNKALTRKIMIQ